MRAVLFRRNFGLLWVGSLISEAGDWGLSIGLPLYVFTITNSAFATSLIFIAGRIPGLFLSSVAGVFVDRWNRRRTLIIVNCLLMLTLLPLLFGPTGDWLWVVFVVVFVEATLGQFNGPAAGALIPQVVRPDELLRANALNGVGQNIARLVGAPLGGIAIGLGGLNATVLLDSATYALAALLALLVKLAPGQAAPAEKGSLETGRLLSVGREWLDGLNFVGRSYTLKVLFGAFAITSIGEGVFGALFIIFVKVPLHGTSEELGLVMGAQAVGGLLGGICIGLIASKFTPTRLYGLSAIIFGLLDLALFYSPLVYPSIPLAALLIILAGFPGSGVGSSATTLIQSAVDDTYRGRVLAATNTIMALFSLIGLGLAGVLADSSNVIAVLTIQGAAYILAGTLVFVMGLSARTEPPNNFQTENNVS